MSPRQATQADRDAVVRLTQAAYAPYTEAWGAPPVPVTEDYAPRIDRGEVWLLEGRDGPAGLIVLERHRDHVMIFSVVVAPDRQGAGVGSRLLRFAEETARGCGSPELRLYTNARMERNIAIYRGAGYRETGRRPHPLRPEFTIVDMAKKLG